MSGNPRDLLYRSLDPAEAAALAARHLSSHDDGELYLQYRVTEAFGFDDGRLKTADYHTASGFGLRGVTGETTSVPAPPRVANEYFSRKAIDAESGEK